MVRQFMIALFVCACTDQGNVVKLEADFCIVIDVDDKQSKQLVMELDAFAKLHDLAIDKSSPVSAVYWDNQKTELILLRSYFGNLGSVLSHYSVIQGVNGEFLVALQTHTKRRLKSLYVLRQCSELDDFAVPEFIYNKAD